MTAYLDARAGTVLAYQATVPPTTPATATAGYTTGAVPVSSSLRSASPPRASQAAQAPGPKIVTRHVNSLLLRPSPGTQLPRQDVAPVQVPKEAVGGASAIAVRSVTRPAAIASMTSPAVSTRSVEAAGSTFQLAQEVSSHEVDLQTLRAEVAAKEDEADKLHNRLRDVHFKLQEAAGTLDTLSVKVETVVGNRQSVLRASAQHIDAHVDTLKRWLAGMEWELVEKDEEIASLRRNAEIDRNTMQQQQDELNSFLFQEEANDAWAAQLEEDARRARRHQAISSWCAQVKAHIDRESADAAVQREQRRVMQQLLETNEMNRWLQAFVSRVEEKCRHSALALEGEGKVRSELLMEERLSDSAAQYGHHSVGDNISDARAEFQALAEQLQQEVSRRASVLNLAKAYDRQEMAMVDQQTELLALTSCLREVTRTLRDAGSSAVDDSIETEISSIVESLQDYGEVVPPLLRISPTEYLIGSEFVRCTMVAGKLFVQAPGILPGDRGALTPIGDFLRHRAQRPPLAALPVSSMAGDHPARYKGLPKLAPALFGPSPTQAAGGRGLPAIMAPIVIGGAQGILGA